MFVRKVGSGALKLVVEVSRDREDVDIDLILVKGNTVRPNKHTLSDVEWFRESWNCAGSSLLWSDEDAPPDGCYEIWGRIEGCYSSTVDGDDYDDEFIIETQRTVGQRSSCTR